ncbi:hypothetical protein TNCV_1274451 [Trichonephila clavipes]|nr:hypothetical protein TNCV_1274451 [Trichonephila clavipes]
MNLKTLSLDRFTHTSNIPHDGFLKYLRTRTKTGQKQRWSRLHDLMAIAAALSNIIFIFFPTKIVEVEIDGVAIYRPFVGFRRANSYCHLVTHTSIESPTETVLFAGLYAHARETYNFFPFPADQRDRRKMVTSEQKAFCVLQLAKTKSAISVQRAFRWTPQ